MKLFDIFKQKKQSEDSVYAKTDFTEKHKKTVAKTEVGEKSVLGSADFTKRFPKIRLYYVGIEKFTRYGSSEVLIGKTFGISSPFNVPYGMTLDEACKVVSYLSEKVERENNLEPASEKSVALVSKLLCDYGFERIEGYEHGHSHSVAEYVPMKKITVSPAVDGKTIHSEIRGVTDLFTVGGDFKLFVRSDLQPRYFDWFTSWVTEEQIKDIYNRIGATSLLPQNKKEDNSNQR